MGALSTYAQGKICDQMLRGNTWTTPASLYLALFTSDPTVAGTGSETTYSGYARQSCGASPFTAIDGTGTTQNNNTIVFPAVGSGSVTIGWWALYDAATVGNMLLFGPLSASKTLNATDVPSFPANALKVTFS